MLLRTIVCLFTATANSMNNTTFNVLPSIFQSNTPTFNSIFQSNTSSTAFPTNHAFTSNTTIFAPLAAPLYRNVTPGDAWVFPSSPNDLGARAMSCECFNPDDQCCMASSPNVAPFCPPNGSTCCGDTFCVVGESCCGKGCCPANTTCNFKSTGPGCCPLGTLCTISTNPICYDHISPNCTNQASPPQGCCPPSEPFCRDFHPYGLGCYASSTAAPASLATSNVPSMTAAGTANFFAAEEESVGVSSYKIATDVHTVTIFVVADGRGGVSLELPTGSAEVGESEGEGGGGETTYVLDWPAGSATAVPVKVDSGSGESTEKAVSSTVGKSTALSATTTIAQSTSKSASSKSASSSTTNSAPSPSSSASSSSQLLCYDPNANSHSPCPTTSTTATPKSSKTSSSGVFNPSGATTVKSQASKLSFLPSSLDRLRNWFRSESGTYSLPLLIAGCVISLCISFWLLSMLYEEARGGKWRGANINIHDVNVPSVKKALRKYDLGGAQIEDIIASMDIHDGGREALRKYGFEEGEIEDVLAGPVIITAGHNDNNDNSTNNDNTDTDTNNNSTADVLRGTMPEPEPNTSTSTVIPLQENQPPTITIVKNSAKPFLEPRVVQKGQIQVVEGSARPWIKGKRTHSLWEGLGGEVVGEGEEGLGHVFVGREEGEGGVE